MLQKYLVLFCWIFVWVGCTLNPSPTATPDPLAYSHDPETMVIYADVYFYPPSELFRDYDHKYREYISPLRIWGDGKTILISSHDKKREILTGIIEEEQLDEILSILKRAGVFEPEDTEKTTPQVFHGSHYFLDTHLATTSYRVTWLSSSPFYDEIAQFLTPYLTPYTPDHAQLFAVESTGMFGGWENDALFGLVILKDWPKEFGISLADIPGDGIEITGSILNSLWEETNTSSHELRYHEDGKIYWVELGGLREDLYVTPTPIPSPTQPFPYPISPTETPFHSVIHPPYPYPTP